MIGLKPCLLDLDQVPRPHLLIYLLDHDDTPHYYWSSWIHTASTMKI